MRWKRKIILYFEKQKNPKNWKSKTFLITSNESLQQFPLFRGNARIFMSWKTNKGENLLRNKTKQIKQRMQVQKLLKLSFCDGYIQNESIPGQKTLSTLFRRRWIKKGKKSREVLCLISGSTKDQKGTRLKVVRNPNFFLQIHRDKFCLGMWQCTHTT